MAWECAYGSSSIRERIYAYSEIGCGILLVTNSSGSEGTLGGLVGAGKRIVAYLEKATRPDPPFRHPGHPWRPLPWL
jgi:hypothetical protein